MSTTETPAAAAPAATTESTTTAEKPAETTAATTTDGTASAAPAATSTPAANADGTAATPAANGAQNGQQQQQPQPAKKKSAAEQDREDQHQGQTVVNGLKKFGVLGSGAAMVLGKATKFTGAVKTKMFGPRSIYSDDVESCWLNDEKGVGHLLKMGGRLKVQWQKRYCMVGNDENDSTKPVLFWADDEDKDWNGFVNLLTVNVTQGEEGTREKVSSTVGYNHEHFFMLVPKEPVGPDGKKVKTYTFAADTAEHLKMWVDCINEKIGVANGTVTAAPAETPAEGTGRRSGQTASTANIKMAEDEDVPETPTAATTTETTTAAAP